MISMKFIFQITTHTNLIFTFIPDQIMIHLIKNFRNFYSQLIPITLLRWSFEIRNKIQNFPC